MIQVWPVESTFRYDRLSALAWVRLSMYRQASLEVSALVKAAKTPAEKVAVAAAHADWSVPALWVFLGSYVVFGAVTWFFYMRTRLAVDAIPSLAGARV